MPVDPDQVKGGVVSAVNNLLLGFSSMNVEVRMVSFNKGIKERISRKLYPNVDLHFLPEGPFPFHSLNYFVKGPGLLKEQIREFDPDIIHLQTGNTFNFVRRSVKTRAKFVQTIHGMAREEAKRKKKWRDKMAWQLNAYLQDKTFPDNVVHLSEFSMKLFGNQIRHNTIIPNAIVPGFFNIPPKNGMDNRLLYIGVIDNNKNILYLLSQMKQLKEEGKTYELDVLGDFLNPEYKEEVMAYIRDHGLEPHVHFQGWVPQSTVLQYITKNDILVVSSKHESLPMVIAEAKAAGKVVVASAVGGIPEMIHDGEDGFLFHLSGNNELARILANLYSNPTLTASISGKARASALEKHHCDKVAAKTVDFYRNCV